MLMAQQSPVEGFFNPNPGAFFFDGTKEIQSFEEYKTLVYVELLQLTSIFLFSNTSLTRTSNCSLIRVLLTRFDQQNSAEYFHTTLPPVIQHFIDFSLAHCKDVDNNDFKISAILLVGAFLSYDTVISKSY